MKKILLYLLFATFIFSACRKDESSLFSQSADQRLNEAITSYQTKLTGAQYGWKGLVYPKAGGIYTFYFKFNNANRVQMLSGLDSNSAVTLKESSYRLKALQQPSLVFDTYSYIHELADPDPGVNGGNVGAGLLSDFEFYFDSTTNDSIRLVGRQNGSRAVLVKATQAEATAFTSGQLANGLLLNKILTYYKRLNIGSVSLDFYFDAASRTIKLPDNTGNLLDSTRMSEYFLTLGGIELAKPLVAGNQIISRLSNISFNAATETISCTVNNVLGTVSPVLVPQKVDVGAPRRWWNSAAATSNYWFSFEGFHVNGVDDAFGVTKLTGNNLPYYYLVYFPKFGSTYDLFAPVFLNAAANSLSLQYGSAPRFPTYTADGRAVFTEIGTVGSNPYPSTGAAAASRTLFYNSSGYYFVQTGNVTYDMVSAADGKAWVSWISTR